MTTRNWAAPGGCCSDRFRIPGTSFRSYCKTLMIPGRLRPSPSVEDGCFVFRHNGHDFSEEEFRSLCRFGFSNKRRALTIGFRGIGFKSVFSLGPTAQILTPTLAFRFDRKRFTQPEWVDSR